jgi:hypothetical protein
VSASSRWCLLGARMCGGTSRVAIARSVRRRTKRTLLPVIATVASNPAAATIQWMRLLCGLSACRLGEHDHSNHGEQKVEHEGRNVLETDVGAQKEDVAAKGEQA